MGGPPAHAFAVFSLHTQQRMLLFRHHVIKYLLAATESAKPTSTSVL
jgi:hypothetical protein